MTSIDSEIKKTVDEGYSEADAAAKVCQDIILNAISKTAFNNNVTIKGGVVMRSISNNVRRATQDMDIDFIHLSLSDDSIKSFIESLNNTDGLKIESTGKITELKQQVAAVLSNKDFKKKLSSSKKNWLDMENEQVCDSVMAFINSLQKLSF